MILQCVCFVFFSVLLCHFAMLACLCVCACVCVCVCVVCVCVCVCVCVGFMLENASWLGTESSTIQFLIPPVSPHSSLQLYIV